MFSKVRVVQEGEKINFNDIESEEKTKDKVFILSHQEASKVKITEISEKAWADYVQQCEKYYWLRTPFDYEGERGMIYGRTDNDETKTHSCQVEVPEFIRPAMYIDVKLYKELSSAGEGGMGYTE